MESVPHILSSFTQTWVAWLMLLLLIGLGAVEIFQPGRYMRAIQSLFTSKERDSIFAASGNDIRSRWLLAAVGIALLALCLQWYYHPEGSFPIQSYLGYLGLSAVYAGTKNLMTSSVGYTFFSKGETDTYVRHYRYLTDCLTLIAWPLLLCGLFTTELPAAAITISAIVLLTAYCVLIIYKLIACFHLVPASMLYIPLYFITTEVLPAGALFAVAGMLIGQ